MSKDDDEQTALATIESRKLRRTRALNATMIGTGVAAGFLAGPLVPTAIGLPVVGAYWYGATRGLSRELDLGQIERYERKLRKEIERSALSRDGQRAAVTLGHILLRRGKHDEARARFDSIAKGGAPRSLRRKGELGAAACARLLGETESVTVDDDTTPIEPAVQLYRLMILTGRGESEAALQLSSGASWVSNLTVGRRRFAHEVRLFDLIKCTVRGSADAVTDAQRAAMVAKYGGEYDYVANVWPQVGEMVTALRLYERILAPARLRTG